MVNGLRIFYLFNTSITKVLTVSKYRYDKTCRSWNCNTDIDKISVYHIISINNCIYYRLFLYGSCGSFYKSTHKAKFNSMLLLECLSIVLSQIYESTHINFIESCKHSVSILSILESLSNSLSHSTHGYSNFCSRSFNFWRSLSSLWWGSLCGFWGLLFLLSWFWGWSFFIILFLVFLFILLHLFFIIFLSISSLFFLFFITIFSCFSLLFRLSFFFSFFYFIFFHFFSNWFSLFTLIKIHIAYKIIFLLYTFFSPPLPSVSSSKNSASTCTVSPSLAKNFLIVPACVVLISTLTLSVSITATTSSASTYSPTSIIV